MGRPRRVFNRQEVIRLREMEHLSWPEIARRMGVGVGTAVKAYWDLTGAAQAFSTGPELPAPRDPVQEANGYGLQRSDLPVGFQVCKRQKSA